MDDRVDEGEEVDDLYAVVVFVDVLDGEGMDEDVEGALDFEDKGGGTKGCEAVVSKGEEDEEILKSTSLKNLSASL